MPDPEEEEAPESGEDEEPEPTAEELAADAIDEMHHDAEVFLRTAMDVVSDLVDAKRVPKSLLDTLETAHDELVELLPDAD